MAGKGGGGERETSTTQSLATLCSRLESNTCNSNRHLCLSRGSWSLIRVPWAQSRQQGDLAPKEAPALSSGPSPSFASSAIPPPSLPLPLSLPPSLSLSLSPSLSLPLSLPLRMSVCLSVCLSLAHSLSLSPSPSLVVTLLSRANPKTRYCKASSLPPHSHRTVTC